MGSEERTLGQVSKFFNNLRKPVTRSNRQSGVYPYYGAAGIQDYVSDYLFEGKYILVGEDGTVVSENNRPVVQIAEGKFWVNNHAHVIRPMEDDDFDYLYYSILGSNVGELVTGAVQPKLSMTNLKSLKMAWAKSAATRRAIGAVLRALDEKIEVNRQLSITLEEIAQAIFKSWFVDFDPVKAKMAGEKPVGMDDATAALFPDSFEDSELGPIPAGWEPTKVDDLLERIKVKSLPKSTEVLLLGRTLVLEQGDSVVSGFVNDDASIPASKESPRFIFGDHTCRTYLSTIPFSVFPNTIVLSSKHSNPYWAFWAIRDLQKFESYRRHWMELAFRTVVVPPRGLADMWGEMVSEIHAQIDQLMIQSRYLKALRDALLPRLISGELQIPEEMMVK